MAQSINPHVPLRVGQRGSGRFRRISWGVTLARIAEEIIRINRNTGKLSVL